MNQLTNHEMELVRFSGLAEMQKHLRARRLAVAQNVVLAAIGAAGCLLCLALFS